MEVLPKGTPHEEGSKVGDIVDRRTLMYVVSRTYLLVTLGCYLGSCLQRELVWFKELQEEHLVNKMDVKEAHM